MKQFLITVTVAVLAAIIYSGCSDSYPKDEDGLLITTRTECYVSNFELLDTGFQTVRTAAAKIDTLACTIDVEVFYGTDLKNLRPQFSLGTDCKLEPKITGFVDFSNFADPKKYMVISGNRQIQKIYTINLSVQKP